MKVLMFGWEFPPFSSGGLGTACYGLTRGLSREGVEVSFVVPRGFFGVEYDFVKLIAANMGRVKVRGIRTLLSAYLTVREYDEKLATLVKMSVPALEIYGRNLLEEVSLYSRRAAEIAGDEPHDVIHAHDWLTFQAGLAAREVSGKPLVVHVHATEFDRTGGFGVNQQIYEIERAGMAASDAVIAVSNYTKAKIVQHYGISPDKVHVVHNAIDAEQKQKCGPKKGKTVLYLGRVTLQKGPDYFIDAAEKVLGKVPDARFIVAGSGDMEARMIERATRLGIADSVLFTGFLRDKDTVKAYELASLYVMPSVSEPFGITPLEAASNHTPVLISRQSGVSEVFSNCLKVNFWDVNAIADKIVSVLRHGELRDELAENAYAEVGRMNWTDAARKCLDVYRRVCDSKI